MKKEYYTPKIEDFYVGFECEFKNSMHGNTWEKEICDTDTIGIVYDSFEHQDYDGEFADTFRVKFLDFNDLLDLGFERTTNFFVLNNGRYFVHLNLIKFYDHVVVRIETSVMQESVRTVVVHSICINNKSDLSKLLSQLNVL